MGHGVSWFTFLPGYQTLETYLQQRYQGELFKETLVLQHVCAALLVAVVLLLMAWRARAQLRRAGSSAIVPDPKASLRNVLEVVLEAFYGQMKQIIGPEAQRYFPVIATLALFIFFSNLLGLVPGFIPPTNNWNTTMGCGFFVFFYYNWHGIRVHGMAHLSHIANPIGTWWGWFFAPLLLPIELVHHCARPFSLGIRLSANMMGDHAVVAAFLGLAPILVPLPFLALGLVVCVVQTMVFVLLTIIFIGLAVANAHDDEASETHGAVAPSQAH